MLNPCLLFFFQVATFNNEYWPEWLCATWRDDERNQIITAFWGELGHYVDGKWVDGKVDATKLDNADIEIVFKV